MRLNISDIMVIESALRDLVRRADADISTLPTDSILREILEKDSAIANRLSGGLKRALSGEIHVLDDRGRAA